MTISPLSCRTVSCGEICSLVTTEGPRELAALLGPGPHGNGPYKICPRETEGESLLLFFSLLTAVLSLILHPVLGGRPYFVSATAGVLPLRFLAADAKEKQDENQGQRGP